MTAVKAAGVSVEIIDIDAQPDLAAKYQIISVPTFVWLGYDGNETERTQDVNVVLESIRPRTL